LQSNTGNSLFNHGEPVPYTAIAIKDFFRPSRLKLTDGILYYQRRWYGRLHRLRLNGCKRYIMKNKGSILIDYPGSIVLDQLTFSTVVSIHQQRIIIMKNLRSIFLMLFVLLFASELISGNNGIKITGIFSDLRYSEESGDICGQELFIMLGLKKYFVVYQISEGAPSNPVLIEANINENKIEFKIPKTKYNSERIFKGIIMTDKLIGNFEGGDTIKLTRQNSYWQ
jgi:hypothetical protein